MVKNILESSKKFLYSKQENILSAATIVMIMVLASSVLGLLKNRVFVHYFPPDQLDSVLAAFRLPDVMIEVFVAGVMSSAFVPIFSGFLGKNKDKEAWQLAGVTLNIMLLIFAVFAVLVFVFSHPIYSLIAQGFSPEKVAQTASFARILIFAQMFFIASYIVTASLESNQRFLASAIAPLFYNLGIIGVTAFFAQSLGLYAPVVGAVVGSALHLGIQLPLAIHLGFRPVFSWGFGNSSVRKIIKLAAPRIFELSFLQIKRFADVFFATSIAGGLTYFRFADSLSILPVGLFGVSIAKASLPQFSKQVAIGDTQGFRTTFASSFKEILFFVLPASIFLAVLRIPVVRLAFGARQFDWEDTVQTGYVLSAFAVGIFAYALVLLLNRAFYALQDTITPVRVSIMTIFLNVGLALLLVVFLKLPIWALALSYALASIFQISMLLILFGKRIGGFAGLGLGITFTKILIASSISGTVMFFLLKVLDRSVWDKKLSFLGSLGLGLPTTFDRFVIDTRYTANLIYITAFVALIGFLVYVFTVWLLKVEELKIVLRVLGRIGQIKKATLPAEAAKEGETITPPHTNGS